jgi:hypothetical protein
MARMGRPRSTREQKLELWDRWKSGQSARALSSADAYLQSRKDRKKVEMLFAHPEPILKLDRSRLRSRIGAQDELLPAATAQYLRRMNK